MKMLHHTTFKFREELTRRDEQAMKYIVLHHSEVVSRHTVEDVHHWHLKRKTGDEEWAGIGYHYFIDKEGEIFEGRPVWAVGSHVRGYNSVSVGICYEGDFNKEQMTVQQEEASIMLIALLSLVYDNAHVVKHSSLGDKNCPGKNFPYSRICRKVHTCKGWLKPLFCIADISMIVDELL